MHPKIQSAVGLYLEGIRDGRPREAVAKYVGDRYTQHNYHVKDGKEGFIEFFEGFAERNPKREVKILRTLVDGRYVFLHSYQNLNEGQSEWVTADFFDTDENDKVIEHWDTITQYDGQLTPSGHTVIDGPTEVKDLDKTEANKQLVRNLIRDALMKGGNPENLDRYISPETYIQHNKSVPDGLEHFQQLAAAPNRPLNYKRIVLMVGQGNFVATLSEANWNDGKKDQDYAQADLFRIEDGKIVEHWDNAEPVRENPINSGKF